jgi:uncharacterized membrane protein
MGDAVKGFLRADEMDRIEACVREAERATRGEIVVMVAPASHAYPMAGLLGAAALSIPAAVVFARFVGALVWAGPLPEMLPVYVPLILFGAAGPGPTEEPESKGEESAPGDRDNTIQ